MAVRTFPRGPLPGDRKQEYKFRDASSTTGTHAASWGLSDAVMAPSRLRGRPQLHTLFLVAPQKDIELLYVTQECFRAVNLPSGPDFGRTATGKAPELALRPAFGRPEGRFRRFPGSSPAEIRPGRPIYGPEARLRNIE